MRRALQLAENGEGRVSPNPMVGAVIIHDGKIIGEGFHAFYGGPHAEVNAINSVKEENKPLLKEATMYVTLEPCSHYGKTPPCANLIVKSEIPEVIIGSLDPNPLVAGKGIQILKNAGIKVKYGILEKECKELNRRFMKAHTSGKPWIILKWAQSADGFIAGYDEKENLKSIKFSSPLSTVWMHRERSKNDAIIVGATTERIDHPLLNVRAWGGNSPVKYVAEGNFNCSDFVNNLAKEGVIGIMVEGGAKLLKSFIHEKLYDEIRVEISPVKLYKGLKAPSIPNDVILVKKEFYRDNYIEVFRR